MGQNRVGGDLVFAAVSVIFAMAASTSTTASAEPDAQATPQPPAPAPPASQPPPVQQQPSQEEIAQWRLEQKERRRQRQLALRAVQPRFFQLAVTGLLGRIKVSRDGEAESGNGRGIAVGAAFYPLPRFALVSEVWWQFGSFGDCQTDFTCIRSVGKRHTVLSIGLRYQPIEALSFDLAGGKHTTWIRQGSAEFSRESVMVLATAAWHAPLRAFDLAVRLRVGTTTVQDAQLTSAGLGLQLGKSW